MENNRWVIDIETSCDVPGCSKGAVCREEEKHALYSTTAKIDLIGVMNADDININYVFKSVADFNVFNAGRVRQFIGHHLKFDFRMLIEKGADLAIDQFEDDTEIMGHVLTDKVTDDYLVKYEARRQIENLKCKVGYTHRKAGKHSLKTMAPFFLGVAPFWEDPSNHDDVAYLLKDLLYTQMLDKEISRRLKEKDQWNFYKNKQLEYSKMILEAELAGVSIDTLQLRQMEVETQQRSMELKKKLDTQWRAGHMLHRRLKIQKLREKYAAMYEQRAATAKDGDALKARYAKLFQAAIKKIPKNINYRSSKQINWLMQDFMALNIEDATGKKTTGKSVLQTLSNEGHSSIQTYLDWREAEKLLTSYYPAYNKFVRGGRIHPTFNVTSTRTGRLSSERPNLQQVPPVLKKVFHAATGRKFVGYDAAAIEAKLICYYTQDPNLYDIIKNGWSIHDYNAKVYFALPCEIHEVKAKYPTQRAAAKRVGFALFYGAGKNRILRAFREFGFTLTLEEAAEMHQRFKQTFKVALQFQRELTQLLENGTVVKNLLGRPIAIENPEDAYMKGFNKLIQSSASDLCLEAARRAKATFATRDIKGKLNLFVHDFIMAEVDEQQADEAAQILIDSMTNFKLKNGNVEIKLEVDGGISSVWSK